MIYNVVQFLLHSRVSHFYFIIKTAKALKRWTIYIGPWFSPELVLIFA